MTSSTRSTSSTPPDQPSPAIRVIPAHVPIPGIEKWGSDIGYRENVLNRNRIDAVRALRIPARFTDATVTDPTAVAWTDTLILDAQNNPRPSYTGDGRFDVSPHVSSGSTFVFCGPVGTGKTHQAFGILRAIAWSGAIAKLCRVTAVELYDLFKPGWFTGSTVSPRDLLHQYQTADVLLIDDFGIYRDSQHSDVVLWRVMNHRWENAKPTIFTTNLTPAEMRDSLTQSAGSRVRGGSVFTALDGGDRRAGNGGRA